jgi:hypothetical protein
VCTYTLCVLLSIHLHTHTHTHTHKQRLPPSEILTCSSLLCFVGCSFRILEANMDSILEVCDTLPPAPIRVSLCVCVCPSVAPQHLLPRPLEVLSLTTVLSPLREDRLTHERMHSLARSLARARLDAIVVLKILNHTSYIPYTLKCWLFGCDVLVNRMDWILKSATGKRTGRARYAVCVCVCGAMMGRQVSVLIWKSAIMHGFFDKCKHK